MNWSARSSEYCVLLSAIFVIISAILWSFFVERRISFDDYGLFNPVYTVWKYGTISYPTYGEFHTMVVHPPTNYMLIGELMRAGLSAPFAEAVGPFLLMSLSAAVIFWSKFSAQAKISLLFGLVAGSLLPWIAFTNGLGVAVTRPDMMVAFAFFGGLVTLESGRLDGWNPPRLCLGAALLTLASTLHYIAILAWVGAFAYIVWVSMAKGKASLRPVAAILLGVFLVAIPFTLLWAAPNLHEILTFTSSAVPFGGVVSNVVSQIQYYPLIFASVSSYPITAFLFLPLAVGIPVVLISTPILASLREARGIAFASLPNSLFLLLVVQRKQEAVYYYPELMVYASAFAVLVFAFGNLLGRTRLSGLGVKDTGIKVMTVVITAILVVSMASVTLNPHYTTTASLSRPDELAIARAAGSEILGPNALVGADIARSYIFGEAYSYFISPTVLWYPINGMNLTAYFGNFDAISVDSFDSDITSNGLNKSLPSWYIDGTLNLRGFYFSSLHAPTLDYLLLSVKQPLEVIGYGTLKNWTVIQFHQNAGGNYTYVAAVCNGGDYLPGLRTLFNNTYALPQKGSNPRQELETFISTTNDYVSHSGELVSGCAIHQETRLSAQKMPYAELLGVLDNDLPILFFASLQSALIARQDKMSTFSSKPLGGVFFDDFSTDLPGQTPTGWNVYEGSGTNVHVGDCSTYGSSTCIVINGRNESGTGYAQLNPQLENVNANSIEFRILANQTDKPINIYGLSSVGSGIGIEVAFLSDGTISYYDGSVFHQVSNYQSGKWYDIKLADFQNGSFDMSINGTLVSQGALMRTPGSVQNLMFQTYPGVVGGSWYVSAVNVTYTVAGPAIGSTPPLPYVVGATVLEGAVVLMIALIVRRQQPQRHSFLTRIRYWL